MQQFDPSSFTFTKYLFFTGKGGVGKTSIACATAANLADSGKKVLLVSTDPASNLQDVFEMPLENEVVQIENSPNLYVANLDPIKAAADYREEIISPYRNKLPESVITNMEEQLSGSCTVEIAAFNEFSHYITEPNIAKKYDHILFDTAPTGHTLRLLQLPSAWSGFISENTHGASCLGQLSGLESKRAVYQKATETLADGKQTTLVLVSRPEKTPLKEAQKAYEELSQLGIRNQRLVINGYLEAGTDDLSNKLYTKQQEALHHIPETLKRLPTYYVPLRSYNIIGLDGIRSLFTKDAISRASSEKLTVSGIPALQDIVDELYRSKKKVIFTMGKGGVGKTTLAAAIALGLSEKGEKVYLATTDPASHLQFVLHETENITMTHIDEKEELAKYREDVLSKARETMTEADIAYIEEDLRSPCTQEIAVFRAFAEIVDKAEEQTVVIDTAPTGHTLLLLDSSQSYHKEVERTQGENIPESVKKLLPRLRSEETEVLIISLAEATPVYEALRLEEDLQRADISVHWWIINASLLHSNTSNKLLLAKTQAEIPWINKIAEHTGGKFACIPWFDREMEGANLAQLRKERL